MSERSIHGGFGAELRKAARDLGLVREPAVDCPTRAELLEAMAEAVCDVIDPPDPFNATMIPLPGPAEFKPAAELPPWRGEQWRRDRRRR